MFVDYTKAFDMVSHPKLFKFLLEMGIPKHLVACSSTCALCSADSKVEMGWRVQRSLHHRQRHMTGVQHISHGI